MQLTYNGAVLATEFTEGGTDAIMGFHPKGEPLVQKVQFVRGKYVGKFPRGQRDVVMTGTITPMPGASLEATMRAREEFYQSLPDSGDLLKMINGTGELYRGAVLGPVETLEMDGVSYGFRLTFYVDAATSIDPTDVPITDPGGAVITDPSGTAITEKP